MFPYINFNIKVVSDHYADHNLFDHCADCHMLKSYVVILMHNTVFTSTSIHTKINISKNMLDIKRNINA